MARDRGRGERGRGVDEDMHAYGRPRPERRAGPGREGYGREDYGRSQRGGEGYGRGDYRGGTAEGIYDRGGDHGGYGRGRYDADPERRADPERAYDADEWRSRGYRPGRGAYAPDNDLRPDVALGFGDERRWGGPHRGRGPKGYTRSDERIREDLCDRLAYDALVDASDIEVAVAGGEVSLAGTVDDRLMRRQAESIAEEVAGVRHVQNDLRVRNRS
jgi:BON domain-containing protein